MARFRKSSFSLPLRVHLLLFGLTCFLPASIAIAYVGFDLARTEQRRVEDQARRIAVDFTRGVDGEVESLTRAMRVLASSPALLARDFRSFRDQAVIVARDNDAGIALRNLDGRHIVNTLTPFGTTPMPFTQDPVLLEADRRAIASRQPVMSNLYMGAAGRRAYVSVDLPVIENGEVVFLLSLAMTPERITSQLRLNELAAEGWLSSVVGTDNRVIARTRDLERFVGQRATGDLVTAMNRTGSGHLRSVTLDGVAVFSVFTTGQTGWRTVVSVPEDSLNAPVRKLVWLLLAMAGLVLAATILGAWAYGRLLGAELSTLADNARRMGKHEPLRPYSLKVREVATAQQAFAEVSEKADALLRELDHRVKNTLSVVQTLAGRTVAEPVSRAVLAGRISALNRAHEALSANRWSEVPLEQLARAVCAGPAGGVALAGPPVQLMPRTTISLAQVFQELAANAVRHGALAQEGGRASLTWGVSEGWVRLVWQEAGEVAAGTPPKASA